MLQLISGRVDGKLAGMINLVVLGEIVLRGEMRGKERTESTGRNFGGRCLEILYQFF